MGRGSFHQRKRSKYFRLHNSTSELYVYTTVASILICKIVPPPWRSFSVASVRLLTLNWEHLMFNIFILGGRNQYYYCEHSPNKILLKIHFGDDIAVCDSQVNFRLSQTKRKLWWTCIKRVRELSQFSF